MAVYNEILTWANSKPLFIQDALRRIISNATITQNDIDEITQLVKKENGDTSITLNAIPINNTHIPTSVGGGAYYPKLSGIKNPININALHNQADLQFANTGLTVIYGNNGSGKSSYSRILKKLCWSRNSNIELKKNVFTPSATQQQVDLSIDENGTNVNYQWIEGSSPHSALSSINVFDNDCGDVYLSRENPTEYKPVGIDVLEKLIPLLNSVSQNLNTLTASYNTQKPNLDQTLNTTQSAQWFSNIEAKTKEDIENYIQFTQQEIDRKNELHTLINTQNPQQNIQNLNNLKARLKNYANQFKKFEGYFDDETIKGLISLRERFTNTDNAYKIASTELNSLNTIEGFGTNPWRTLWDAAKIFALSNGMSDGQNFPSGDSLNKCVLCQQDLDDAAQKRLMSFNQFVLNDISKQLNTVQQEIQQKINEYESIQLSPIENYVELTQNLKDFDNVYNAFNQSLTLSKNSLINFLKNGVELKTGLNTISEAVLGLIPNIDNQLAQNNQLLQNRTALIKEYNELLSKDFLFNNKATILQYHAESKYKSWITNCQSQLSTYSVSRKIGDLMSDQAVTLQHQEFLNHLSYFNAELSTNVIISKTRTSMGNTFQKCTLNGIADPIVSILSEGEQKIIALSNFFAECTIDGRKNSIIFDDPVTSLDMDYRDLIANKIVELSVDRQIIVLTHDLSFLRLLIDTHKSQTSTDCHVIGIDKYNGISGVVTDEIPYLAKNVDERVDSIRRILREHDSLNITDGHGRETKLDSARKRFRMLLERSVEEILANKTYERFSKNINLKKGNLSSFIVVEQSDVDFLLVLFSKYSVTEHDGGTSTIPQSPSKEAIEQDIKDYMNWKNSFKAKHKAFVQSYN